MLAIAGLSTLGTVLKNRRKLLRLCFDSIFFLPPSGEMWSREASLYSQTLHAMDTMLEVMVFSSPASKTSKMLQDILEVLLHYCLYDTVAVQERVMGRIRLLSHLLADSSTVQAGQTEDSGAASTHVRIPVLGKLLGHLFFKLFRKEESSLMALDILCFLFTFLSEQKCATPPAVRAQLPAYWQSEITSLLDTPSTWRVQEEDFVREHSIRLFRDLLGKTDWKDKAVMKKYAWKALVQLFLHMSDQAPSVAKASTEAVLAIAELLKWKELKQLAQMEQTWRMGECLLAKDSSRAEQFVWDSQRYLWSPQAPMREAALRFIGLAARHLTEQSEDTVAEVLWELDRLQTGDKDPAICSLAAQTSLVLKSPRKQRRSGFSLRALCCWCR
ncbi:uncharacterized protein LOC116437155 [Corvus moneduloides]|uniref:uncharacterized protein LOC116437155 n=1 Tax=Corvus moneduloides TaxID=1196302 RepID=UPI00136232AB|nr:uncharacterized protein LOC116437155 [Corvus moneduloides]